MKILLPATLALLALAAPALAETGYPVNGKWGQSNSTEKGAIDCGNLRVIEFNGETRTDSKGGVPAYRLRTITEESATRFRVTDEFSTGQINNAHVDYTLQKVDADHIELNMQPGGVLKLQRCK